MREKKFTVGPWELFGYTDECIEIDIVHDYKYVNGKHQADRIANLQEENVKGGFSVMEANAHLIAAAPEMLAEVEKSCIRCSWQDDFMGSDIANCPQVKTCGKAKAIAKAYGEDNV